MTTTTQEEQLKNLRQQENNSFPVSVFNPAIQAIINNAQTKLRFAPDWTATSLLYAASAAIGRTLEIQHSPDWHEGPTLYVCLIGPPGTGKTHPLTKALKPLNDHDNVAYQLYQQELKDYKRTMQNWKKLPPDVREIEPDKPIWNHTIVSDFTPEALIRVHSENPRSTAVHVDELKGFFKNFTRYNTGGVQEFFLSNWSRQAIQTDRKGSDPIKIDTPSIGVAGTIQPGILDSLADQDRSENGFLHRFLFAWPEVQAQPWDTTPPRRLHIFSMAHNDQTFIGAATLRRRAKNPHLHPRSKNHALQLATRQHRKNQQRNLRIPPRHLGKTRSLHPAPCTHTPGTRPHQNRQTPIHGRKYSHDRSHSACLLLRTHGHKSLPAAWNLLTPRQTLNP